jgi:PDZ domain
MLVLPSSLLAACALLTSCAQSPAFESTQESVPFQAQAQPASATLDKLIPATIVRDYFIVPIALDGREDRVLWMLYDTGASITVVDGESLQAVSDWKPSQGNSINLVSATCGPAKMSNISARVRDLDHISDALGFPIDGILGYSSFTGTLLTLDYPAGEMRVRKGELPKADGRTVFPITRKERRRPFIEFELGGRIEEVLIDSGSGSGFVLEDRRGRKFLGTPVALSMMMGINGPRAEKTGRLDGDAALFGRHFASPAVRLTEGTELLGTQVLRHFALTFDIANRRVQVLGALNEQGQPLPSVRPSSLWTSGVLKSATATGHEVRGLLPDSPGAKAGLKKGDLVVEVNGVPYSERGGEPIIAFRDGVRRWISMVVERDGERIHLELERAEYIPVPEGIAEAPPRYSLPQDLIQQVYSEVGPSANELEKPASVLSPDGNRRAEIIPTDAGTRVRVSDQLGRILGHPVLRGRNLGLQWSADGRWLAFWREVEQDGEKIWSRWAVPANGFQPPEPVPIR